MVKQIKPPHYVSGDYIDSHLGNFSCPQSGKVYQKTKVTAYSTC